MTVKHITLDEVVWLHERVIARSGGGAGIRDRGSLDACIHQPRMTFGGQDLYPSLPEKAAALAFSLVRNHPFVDGNKRIGFAAMRVFLMRNGSDLHYCVDNAEETFLSLAAGQLTREQLIEWINQHIVPAQYQ